MTEQTEQTEQTEEPEPEPGPDGTFPAEVVHRLRSENAQRRVEARDATEALQTATARMDALAGRLLTLQVTETTRSILADPSDLLALVPNEDLLDDDGAPDPEKIKAAAKELVAKKAHLAPRTGPSGDVDQGAREPAPEAFDFAGALRRAAN